MSEYTMHGNVNTNGFTHFGDNNTFINYLQSEKPLGKIITITRTFRNQETH